MEILLRNGFQSRKKNITGDMIEKMYKDFVVGENSVYGGKNPMGQLKGSSRTFSKCS